MSLNKETLGWIAELAGVSVEDITTKINSEKEEGLNKPQGTFFNEDELNKRDSSKFNEGKIAGVEMSVKNLKKEKGYDFEGKDLDTFLSYHEEQIKTKYSKNSNERVQELENDLKKQKNAFEEEINGYKNQLTDLSGKYKGESIKNKLYSIMPKETTIKKEAIVTLFKSEYDIDTVEGKTIVKKNGEPLKNDKTGEYIPLENVFNEYVVVEGFSKSQSGRGAGNEFGTEGKRYTAKSPQDFERQWREKNPDKSTTSNEYAKDYAEFRKSQAA